MAEDLTHYRLHSNVTIASQGVTHRHSPTAAVLRWLRGARGSHGSRQMGGYWWWWNPL